MDEQSRSERGLSAVPAGAAIGPSYGRRPEGTQYSSSRSGLAALPSKPPPSPHFSGPMDPTPIGKPIGTVAPRWYQAKWLWILTALVVVAGAVAYFVSASGDESAGGAAAQAAPAGYRMVETKTYQFAVPLGWTTQALDSRVMEQSDGASPAANGAKALTVASDAATRDSINVVPYTTAAGASLEKSVLAEFEHDFRNGVADTEIKELRVDPTTVHGWPAGRLTASVEGPDGAATVISTVVQTDDGLFQITITSASPERARTFDDRVLPTFDLR